MSGQYIPKGQQLPATAVTRQEVLPKLPVQSKNDRHLQAVREHIYQFYYHIVSTHKTHFIVDMASP